MKVILLTTLLVDGDILAYRACASKEVATEVEPGYWTWHCHIDEVKIEIDNSLKFLLSKLKASDYKLCLSDDYNFRRDLSPTYKDHRSKYKRPLVLKPTREWMISEMGALVYPNLEGDDIMGILQTQPDKQDDTIIVSIDKDMKTISGKIYVNDTMYSYTEEEADYNHLMQTLCGDRTDGYFGIKGCGPVAAAKILARNANWNAVKTAYEKAGMTEEEALTQARLARILRWDDYDHENKQVKLWTPK